MTKAGERILSSARQALAFSEGKDIGARVHVPEAVDVRAIRKRTGMSQGRFAAAFGFPVATLRGWEQGRRQPDVTARALLTVIDRQPQAVREALSVPFPANGGGSRTAKGKSQVAGA